MERPPGQERIIPDATLALDWMMLHYDAMNASQQHAFEALIDPTGAMPLSWPKGPLALPSVPSDVEQLAMDAVAAIAANTGEPIPNISLIARAEPYAKNASGLALSDPLDVNGQRIGAPTQCVVSLFPLFFTVYNDPTMRNIAKETIAHEVFHCFMTPMFGTIANKNLAPDWLREGSAEWAGDEIVGTAQGSIAAWNSYLTNPKRSLFVRSYDALGFIALMKSAGIDPWKIFTDMAAAWNSARKSEVVFQLVLERAPQLLRRMATSIARESAAAWGAEWNVQGVDIPSMPKYARPSFLVGSMFVNTDVIGSAATDVVELEITAEIAIILSPEASHLKGDNGVSIIAPSGVYCTLSNCDCPATSPHAGEVLPHINPDKYLLAMAGGSDGALWTVVGMTKAAYCQNRKIDPCLIGSWTLQGGSALAGASTEACTWPSPLGSGLVITEDGAWSIDNDSFGLVECPSDGIALKFGGQAFGTFSIANYGYMKGTGDDSALTVETFAGGVSTGVMPYSSFAPGGYSLTGEGYSTYRCTDQMLTIDTGLSVNDFAR